MILLKVVTQPTEKPKSVGPHKSIPKKSRNKRKSRLENEKFRSVIKPLYGISADHNNKNVCYTRTKTRTNIYIWILVYPFQ